jgi:hypothetical protein
MLMVTADLTKMAMLARSKEGGFNAGHFIDSIQHHLGPDGTLIIPSFNFNLQNNDSYHHWRLRRLKDQILSGPETRCIPSSSGENRLRPFRHSIIKALFLQIPHSLL